VDADPARVTGPRRLGSLPAVGGGAVIAEPGPITEAFDVADPDLDRVTGPRLLDSMAAVENGAVTAVAGTGTAREPLANIR